MERWVVGRRLSNTKLRNIMLNVEHITNKLPLCHNSDIVRSKPNQKTQENKIYWKGGPMRKE